MIKLGKKLFAIFGNVSLVVFLLSGCGKDLTEQQDSEHMESTAITLLASQNWIREIDRILFQEFEEETGIEVRVLLTPDNGYKSLVGTCLSGGNNAVDIFMFPVGSALTSMGIQNMAVDLSDESWVADLEDWALESGSYQGKVIGFNTWGMDYEGILYNKSFFQEHNLEVPDTWEGFLTLCDQIRTLGIVPLYEGINGSWHTRSWVDGLTPVLYKERPDLPEYLNAGPDHKFADISCFSEGLEQIRQLFSEKEDGVPQYYISDGQDEDFKGSYQYLKERRTVMMFTYSAYAGELEAYGSQDEWGMFPVPLLDNQTVISNGGGMAKFINKYSHQAEACKKLFQFLAKKENLERYYDARTDLTTSAFRDVKSVHTTDATREVLSRSKEEPVVMFVKDVFYTDPNLYQYLRGFANGTCSVEQAVKNIDTYRKEMFVPKLTEP